MARRKPTASDAAGPLATGSTRRHLGGYPGRLPASRALRCDAPIRQLCPGPIAMHRLLIATLSLTGLATAQDSELYVCNSNTVRSTALHPITMQPYPYGPCCPNEYQIVGPGTLPGTRSWNYTPRLRYQAGSYGPNFLTVTGMIQTIRVGAA